MFRSDFKNDTGICSVQTSLNDFVGGLPPFNELVADCLYPDMKLGYDVGVHALGNGYFENAKRIRPFCGKSDKKVNKKDFRERTFIKEKFGRVTVFLRRYYCNHCSSCFKQILKRLLKLMKEYLIF